MKIRKIDPLRQLKNYKIRLIIFQQMKILPQICSYGLLESNSRESGFMSLVITQNAKKQLNRTPDVLIVALITISLKEGL